MRLYCITYKGKPVSVDKLRKVNKQEEDFYYRNMSSEAIVSFSPRRCKAEYLRIFGFTWKERPKDVEIEPLEVSKYLSPF